jgi:hypothetical protein
MLPYARCQVRLICVQAAQTIRPVVPPSHVRSRYCALSNCLQALLVTVRFIVRFIVGLSWEHLGTFPTAGIAAIMQIPIDLHPARFNVDRSSAGHSIVSRWRTTQVGLLICHRPHSESATRRSCPVFAWRVANAALVALPKQLCQQCHPLPQQVLGSILH